MDSAPGVSKLLRNPDQLLGAAKLQEANRVSSGPAGTTQLLLHLILDP
jgi:hypothetical protein